MIEMTLGRGAAEVECMGRRSRMQTLQKEGMIQKIRKMYRTCSYSSWIDKPKPEYAITKIKYLQLMRARTWTFLCNCCNLPECPTDKVFLSLIIRHNEYEAHQNFTHPKMKTRLETSR